MKKIIALACLATAALNVHAAERTYDFVYQGFDLAGGFGSASPVKSLGGSFSGDDRNGDNILTLDELTSLKIEGYDYVDFPNLSSGSYQLLGGVNSFEYRGGTDLHFNAGYTETNAGALVYSEFYDFDEDGTPSFGYSIGYGFTWKWVPYNTTLTITSAVPEPSGIALTLAGLALVGAVARRRK